MSCETPRKLCFGNYLSSKDCRTCEQASACKDDQAGWGISTLEADLTGTLEIQNVVGHIPEWVQAWDTLSTQQLEGLRIEDPDKYKLYSLLNSGIRD